MIIFSCPKCKLTDLGDPGEEKRCMRCGTPMLSLGITSAEWNEYSPERMKAVVDDRVDEYNRLNTPHEISAPAPEPAYSEPPKPVRPEISAEREEAPAPVPKAPETPGQAAPTAPRQTTPVPARRKSIQEPAERFNAAASNTTENEGKFTKLSIVALVLSILGCTAIIGIILGIVDLIQGSQQGDNRKKGMSIAAIAVGAGLMIFGSLFTFLGAGQKYIDMVRQKDAVEQTVVQPEAEPTAAPAAEPAEEPEATEEAAEEAAEEASEEDAEEEEPAADDEEDTSDEDTSEEDTAEDDADDEEDGEEVILEDDTFDDEEVESEDSSRDDKSEEETVGEEVVEEEVSEEERSEEETEPEEPAEAEEETSGEKHVPKIVDDWSSEHATAAIAAASIAANGMLSDYQMSLAPQSWSLAKYDDTDTVIGVTEITYKGKKGLFIYVGTLQMNDAGKIQDATTHYMKVNGEVLSDDGYCEDVSATIKELGL